MKNYQKTNLFLILFSFGILTFLGTLSFTSIQEDDIINSKIDAYFSDFENLNQYTKKDSITPNVITYSQIKNFNENDNYNNKKKDVSSSVTTYSKANIAIAKREIKDISNRVTTYSKINIPLFKKEKKVISNSITTYSKSKNSIQKQEKKAILNRVTTYTSLKNNNQNKKVNKNRKKGQEKNSLKKIVTSRKKITTSYNSPKKEDKIVLVKTTKKTAKAVKKIVQKPIISKITNHNKKHSVSNNTLVKKTRTHSTLSNNIPSFKKSKIPVKSLHYAKKELNTATNIHLVESAPVYPNCNNKLTENDKKSCLLTNVSKYVLNHFNTNVGKKSGLKKGFYEIRVLFIIDEKGISKTYKVLGKYNSAIKNEIQRIINNLPKMIPGKANGKNIPVKYSVKVLFEVK